MIKQKGISLGKIFGIPIILDWTWFIVFGLLTWSLGGNHFPQRQLDWPVALSYSLGAFTSIMLFVSVFLHEVGHSVAALAYRLPVRRIRLTILGGVAELGDEPPSPISDFVIAAAGPFVTGILTVVFSVIYLVSGGFELLFGLPLSPERAALAPITETAQYLAFVNLLLGAFNLIPGFPLDGGRIFRAVVWGITGNMHQGTLIAANLGRLFAFGFIVLGVFEVFSGMTVNGLWSMFIGVFLNGSATVQVHMQKMRTLLSKYSVEHAMRRDYAFISADTTVEQILSTPIYGHSQRALIVRQGETPIGLLSAQELKAVPQQEQAVTTARQAMKPLQSAAVVAPEMVLWKALLMMDNIGLNQLIVTSGSQFLGLLRRDDVLHFARSASPAHPI